MGERGREGGGRRKCTGLLLAASKDPQELGNGRPVVGPDMTVPSWRDAARKERRDSDGFHIPIFNDAQRIVVIYIAFCQKSTNQL